jgi:hypothetical protein
MEEMRGDRVQRFPSAMAMPHGRTMRMSPRASMWVAMSCGARSGCEAGDAAKWRFEGGSHTGPLHSTEQCPFQDVVAQCKLCGQGAASHGVAGVQAAECSPAAALDRL